MSPETAATLACTVIGLVVLVLNYLRERGPHKSVTERLDTVESDVTKLKTWNRYE